ncbi:6502_t:CDS:2, partial [Ambispora leptoticha]
MLQLQQQVAHQSQLIGQLQQKVEALETFNQQLIQMQDEKLPEDPDIYNSTLIPTPVYTIDTLIPYEEYTT